MDHDLLIGSFSAFVALFVLGLALRAWRLSYGTFSREELFAIRADLFDAAHAKDAFRDKAYRDFETNINGTIRWIDSITGPAILSLLLQMRMKTISLPEAPAISDSVLKRELENAERRLRETMWRHMWMVGPTSFMITFLIWVTGKMSSLWPTVERYSRKMAADNSRDIDSRSPWDPEIRPAL